MQTQRSRKHRQKPKAESRFKHMREGGEQNCGGAEEANASRRNNKQLQNRITQHHTTRTESTKHYTTNDDAADRAKPETRKDNERRTHNSAESKQKG